MESHNPNSSKKEIINFTENDFIILYDKISYIDFAELFYEWMGPTLRGRFFETAKHTEMAPFIYGLEYELGLNFKPKDLKQAYDIYEYNAQHTTDCLSMFRMYDIHFRDYKKFNIKQDQALMMYYLCKSCAYMPIYVDNYFIYKLITPWNDVSIIVELLDNTWQTYTDFFNWFKRSKQYTHLHHQIDFIKLAPMYILGKVTDYSALKAEATKDNPEIMLKLADSLYFSNKEYTLELLEQLVDMKYYRAYDLYAGIVIMELEMYEEGAKRYHDGMLGGNFNCFGAYYFAKLKLIDFSNQNEIIQNLLGLLDPLLDSLLFQDFFMFEEFFIVIHYLQKRGIKIPTYYIKCVDDIATYLLSLNNLRNDDLLASLGALYGFGISTLIPKDYDKALECYNKILTISAEGNGRYRAAFGMIHSIKKKLFNEGKITKDELDQVARRHLKAAEANIDFYTLEKVGSSGTYFAARLRELIPEKKDELVQQFYYYEKSVASTNPTNVLQTNLRKEKSRKKLLEERMKCFRDNKDEILQIYNGSNSGNSGSNSSSNKPKRVSKLAEVKCEICIDNNISIVLAPCLHKMCEECYYKLHKETCPFCRVPIDRIIKM